MKSELRNLRDTVSVLRRRLVLSELRAKTSKEEISRWKEVLGDKINELESNTPPCSVIEKLVTDRAGALYRGSTPKITYSITQDKNVQNEVEAEHNAQVEIEAWRSSST
jgi:hypothetical protein